MQPALKALHFAYILRHKVESQQNPKHLT